MENAKKFHLEEFHVDMLAIESALAFFFVVLSYLCLPWWAMSVLDDFVRMRVYRKRAAEFEQLAEAALTPHVQDRYRVIASHYKELADRLEQTDRARMAERLELLRLKRQQAAEQATLPARSSAPTYLLPPVARFSTIRHPAPSLKPIRQGGRSVPDSSAA